jgi:hypothetical protein
MNKKKFLSKTKSAQRRNGIGKGGERRGGEEGVEGWRRWDVDERKKP